MLTSCKRRYGNMKYKVVVSAATKEDLLKAVNDYYFTNNIVFLDNTFVNIKTRFYYNLLYRFKNNRHQAVREV